MRVCDKTTQVKRYMYKLS